MKMALLIGFLLPSSLWAGETPSQTPTRAKSQFNTQVYEQSSDEATFSAVVKIIRNIQGETEVIFEGHQGFYTVAPGVSQEALVKSQKKKIPVAIRWNQTSRQILKADFNVGD